MKNVCYLIIINCGLITNILVKDTTKTLLIGLNLVKLIPKNISLEMNNMQYNSIFHSNHLREEIVKYAQ